MQKKMRMMKWQSSVRATFSAPTTMMKRMWNKMLDSCQTKNNLLISSRESKNLIWKVTSRMLLTRTNSMRNRRPCRLSKTSLRVQRMAKSLTLIDCGNFRTGCSEMIYGTL